VVTTGKGSAELWSFSQGDLLGEIDKTGIADISATRGYLAARSERREVCSLQILYIQGEMFLVYNNGEAEVESLGQVQGHLGQESRSSKTGLSLEYLYVLDRRWLTLCCRSKPEKILSAPSPSVKPRWPSELVRGTSR